MISLTVILFSIILLFYYYSDHLHLPSFPTRRSSDLSPPADPQALRASVVAPAAASTVVNRRTIPPTSSSWYMRVNTHVETIDRKSTRLNSSHVAISYAVFCLKKKKEKN